MVTAVSLAPGRVTPRNHSMHRVFTLFADLSDDELLDRVSVLAARERRATAELVAALAELERRKLYLAQGYSSLFVYCTRVLHLSEHAAYNRIEAARASLRFPAILEGIDDGSLSLATVRLLAPILTPDNCGRLLGAAAHRSKRDVELLAAGERPRPDAPTLVRRLPGGRTTAAADPEPSSLLVLSPGGAQPVFPTPPPASIHRFASEPLSPERYKIQFTASREFHDKLRRAQMLLRHAVPSGDPAAILDRAVDLLIAKLEKRKTGTTSRPHKARETAARSRHVPAAVRREVWKRDGGRCAFVGAAGRCSEEAFLEFHHVMPFADGGLATTTNIELRCRAHNVYESDRIFKPLFSE